MKSPKFYTTTQIAELCGVAVATVRNWCDTDQLYAFCIPSGHRRVAREDLAEFLRKNGMPTLDELERDPDTG